MPTLSADGPAGRPDAGGRRAHRVVIVGGGFGGLRAARSLRRAPVDVTLIDRRNFHLFQPLLYQVAMGGLSPANVAAPLRAILRRQPNVRVLLDEAIGFDVAGRQVVLKDGRLEYDTLVVAAGARHHYFGHEEWEALAPGLKTIEDATAIRSRVLGAFEAAEWESDRDTIASWLTIVVVGGGPTGVELAGSLGELARHTLRNDFRAIDPVTARIILIEIGDRILPLYPPGLSGKAALALARLGVEVRVGAEVRAIEHDAVTIRCGGRDERIACRTVLWAAGVKASPLGPLLAGAAGTEIDSAGRLVVGADLTLAGHPEIFVIGDLAHARGPAGDPLPGIAPVAIQQGRYVAALIRRRLRGRRLPPFRYRDRGNMATIGRAAAVADLGWLRFSGYPAWLTWLFVHLMSLVGYHNRVLVFVQLAWNYATRNRAARLITGGRS